MLLPLIAETGLLVLALVEIFWDCSSDEDIQHLHNTIEKLLEILKVMNPNAPIKAFEQIKELISVDTLKSIQLLGCI